MKKASINIYTYDELSNLAKRRARDACYSSNIDLAFSYFQETCSEFLSENYKIDGTVYYSLSYSQGDGLHFNTDNILTEEIVRKIVEDYAENGRRERMKKLGEALIKLGISIEVKSKNRHYEYASMYDIEAPDSELIIDSLQENLPDQFKDVSRTVLQKDYDYFITRLQFLYLDICKTLETTGYGCYDTADEMTDEDVQNSYFTQSGGWFSDKDDYKDD